MGERAKLSLSLDLPKAQADALAERFRQAVQSSGLSIEAAMVQMFEIWCYVAEQNAALAAELRANGHTVMHVHGLVVPITGELMERLRAASGMRGLAQREAVTEAITQWIGVQRSIIPAKSSTPDDDPDMWN